LAAFNTELDLKEKVFPPRIKIPTQFLAENLKELFSLSSPLNWMVRLLLNTPDNTRKFNIQSE
jgi:hypothetical protein